MQRTPQYILLLLLLTSTISSCTMSNRQPEPANPPPDSALKKAANDFKNFGALLPYFVKDSVVPNDSTGKIYLPIDFEKPTGEFDSAVKIPFAHLRDYMGENIDTVNEISIYPVTLIKNIHSYSFIIRVDCHAGGFCAVYYLLRFTPEGDFLEKKSIGMDAGEANESVYFGYSIGGDSLLKTYEIRSYEEDQKADDTVINTIDLR